MDNYSAMYTFLWLSPSLYKQKKQIWFHCCWPLTDALSPTKMDLIFVGFPGQQKWKKIWRFHHVAKFVLLNHVSVLQYWNDSTASSMMTQSKNASSVWTIVSQCQDSQLSFLHSHLYVYAREQYCFVERCFVAHHGKQCDLRCNRDISSSWL
jgi:hypothetical protein